MISDGDARQNKAYESTFLEKEKGKKTRKEREREEIVLLDDNMHETNRRVRDATRERDGEIGRQKSVHLLNTTQMCFSSREFDVAA